MAIPAIIALAMRAATALGAEAGGAGAAATAAPRLGKVAAGQDAFDKLFKDHPANQPGAAGKAAEGTKKFGDSLKEVNQQFAFANYNAHAFANYVHAIPAKFVATATLAIDALSHAAQPFVNLVGRNNPAVTKQWELALNDAYGVIGRSLIPIVQAFTRVARSLGDTMAGLEPVFRPAVQSLAMMVDVIGGEVNAAIRENAFLFQGLAGVLRLVAIEVAGTARMIGLLGKVAVWATSFGSSGLQQSNFDPNATSMGAGIRGAKQVGNAEDLQNDLIKNALMTGAGGETKEDKQVTALQEISTTTAAILKICEWWQGLKNGAEKYVDAAGKLGSGHDSGVAAAVTLRALLHTS